MTLTQQKEICEEIVENARAQYAALVSQIQDRSHWEAVRLGAAVHSRDEAAAAQLAEGIKKAMALQGAKFDAALNHRVQQLQRNHVMDVAQRLLAQKKQMEGKMEKKVQQVMEEAEHQREEALQIQLAQVNQEVLHLGASTIRTRIGRMYCYALSLRH